MWIAQLAEYPVCSFVVVFVALSLLLPTPPPMKRTKIEIGNESNLPMSGIAKVVESFL